MTEYTNLWWCLWSFI